MIRPEQRQLAITLIQEAVAAGARQHKACEVLDISARTYRRWQAQQRCLKTLEDQRQTTLKVPANQLTEAERQQVIAVCNEPAYQDMPPSQIVPRLADEGRYLASESTFYRILKAAEQLHHRGRAKLPKKIVKPKGYKATRPNQIYTWDITYLAATVEGRFFYLYLVEDIFSRKIVGWEVHTKETSENASQLIDQIALREGHAPIEVLHSDNGSPMKGATMLATLQRLGIVPSFSRPRVSNDNPYSESLFRTLKYAPKYPIKRFETLEDARQWVSLLAEWYNDEHRHSGIRFVTPNQRHRGEDPTILQRRHELYLEARQKTPQRWSGNIRNWSYTESVWLNPPKDVRAQL